MTAIIEIAEAFVATGDWHIRHRSADADGTTRSIYVMWQAIVDGRLKEREVRVSDHHLGITVYGEEQGQWLDADFVVTDFPEDTPATDFVVMARDMYTIEIAAQGYTPSMKEWDQMVADEIASYE